MTFGPSSSEISIAISIVDDDINEAVEQFFARLALADQNTGVDVELNPDKTTIEIIDNDCKHHCECSFTFKLSIHNFFILSLTAVQIGFARTLYSIDEAASEVTLSVAVLSGHLSSDTLVRLKTGDNSATGLYNSHFAVPEPTRPKAQRASNKVATVDMHSFGALVFYGSHILYLGLYFEKSASFLS